jgi:hypothetical protein
MSCIVFKPLTSIVLIVLKSTFLILMTEISTIIMKKREQCKADMDEKIRLIEGERP